MGTTTDLSSLTEAGITLFIDQQIGSFRRPRSDVKCALIKAGHSEPYVERLICEWETRRIYVPFPEYSDCFQGQENKSLLIPSIGKSTVQASAVHVLNFARNLLAAAHYTHYSSISSYEIRAIASYWEALSTWQSEVELGETFSPHGSDGGS